MNVYLKIGFIFMIFFTLVNKTVFAAPYPPDTTLTNIKPPSVPRPGYLSPITDPTFHTKITRVSDQSAMGLSAKRLAHYYSKNQPWNADGSLILLSFSSPSPLLNGNTYQFIRNVSVPFYPLWSHIDPKKLYGTYSGSHPNRTILVSCNIDTCNTGNASTLSILHDFSNEGYTFISIGEQEGNISNDDTYVVLYAEKGSGSYYAITFDITTKSIIATKSFGTHKPDNVAISQSGNYVLVDWASSDVTSRGMEVYDRNLQFLRQIYTSSTHYELGYDTSGHEVWVGQTYFDAGKLLIARRLDGGGEYVLTNDSPGWRSPGHISCRNIKRPGWCYISDDGTITSILGYDEVSAVKIDNTKTFERFGHLHHTHDPNVCYECDAMAVPNPDGSKVMFASEWGSGSGGPIYAYVAEAQGNQTVTPSDTKTPTPTVTFTVTPRPTDTFSPTLTIPPKPGDSNNDTKVDGIDYLTWLTHYNQTTLNVNKDGDFNANGKVDGADYIIWLTNYGK
jgi:hypothetical protein